MQQPPLLTDALAALLEGVPRKELAAAAQAHVGRLSRGANPRHTIATPLAGPGLCGGAHAGHLCRHVAVFARLAEVMPDFAPSSLLDVGAGTGAASWAAVTQWPSLGTITMLEPNPALRALARRLAENGPLASAEFLSGSLDAEKPEAIWWWPAMCWRNCRRKKRLWSRATFGKARAWRWR